MKNPIKCTVSSITDFAEQPIFFVSCDRKGELAMSYRKNHPTNDNILHI